MTRIGSLFSGYGGLEQGVQSVLGGTVAWHSEIDPGACKILAHRHPDVPNLGDITRVGLGYSDDEWSEMLKARQFHGLDYELPDPDWSNVEPVDVLVGGFPCQDVSAAGKRAGIKPGTRSGLWAYFAHAIDQLHPGLVVIENVRGLLSADAQHPAHSDLEPCPWCVGDGDRRSLRALGAVLGELADLGYDASWQGLRASDVGAPHGRFRVFVVAWPAADADGLGHERGRRTRDGRLGSADGRDAAPNASSNRRDEGRPEPARVIRRSDAPFGGAAPAADADRDGREGLRGLLSGGRDADGRRSTHTAWGEYEPAVRRWERLTRPAPSPTEPGPNGPRLSPAFSEWMQGLPAGWVTDPAIWTGIRPTTARNMQLHALGNGVVPQQAAHALRLLLPDVAVAA